MSLNNIRVNGKLVPNSHDKNKLYMLKMSISYLLYRLHKYK